MGKPPNTWGLPIPMLFPNHGADNEEEEERETWGRGGEEEERKTRKRRRRRKSVSDTDLLLRGKNMEWCLTIRHQLVGYNESPKGSKPPSEKWVDWDVHYGYPGDTGYISLGYQFKSCTKGVMNISPPYLFFLFSTFYSLFVTLSSA